MSNKFELNVTFSASKSFWDGGAGWEPSATSMLKKEELLAKPLRRNLKSVHKKTVSAPPKNVWELITSPKGLKIWLGDIKDFELKKGYNFKTSDGKIDEIRTFEKGEKIRLTWKPMFWEKPSTLQLYLLPKCALIGKMYLKIWKS